MKLETGVVCGGIDGVHDTETNSGQGTYPPFLVPFHVKTDGLVDSFVCALAGAIRLRVVARGHLQLDTTELKERFQKARHE